MIKICMKAKTNIEQADESFRIHLLDIANECV